MTTVEQQYRVIGTNPVRPDGVDKVTGRAVYGADVRVSGRLIGRVKRSPHAHALVKRIDTSKALALPGVLAVITIEDFPARSGIMQTIRGPIPTAWDTERVMAGRKVLFRGHPVAAVAATDMHIAEDALELIDVEYEVLPAVTSLEDALSPSAPILHDDGLAALVPGLLVDAEGKPSNIARSLELSLGDIEAGFAEADVIVEREYITSMAHQGYIEPHNATAIWNADGRVTVWTSSQGTFGIRSSLASMLEIPLGNIRVIPAEIGGGFGAKLAVYLEPLAVLLSKKTGRPVQLTMNRTEILEATGPTSGMRSWVKMGAKKDGTITAADIRMDFEAGAYPGSPMPNGVRTAVGPYNIPHQHVIGYDVVLNRPKTQAYRAPGAPSAEFGVEALVDELAEVLQMDPMELRLKNAAEQGTPRTDGALHGSVAAKEVMEAVLNHPHYRSELHGQDVGRGVAVGFWHNGGGEASAYANVHGDGRVTLITGSVDIGGQRAGLAMQFAETMGLEYDQISSILGDTDTIGFTSPTSGSRTTFSTGWAVYQAAMDIRQQMEARIAKIWECEANEVTYDPAGDGDGPILRGPEGKTMTYLEACRRLPGTGGMIQGQADIVSTNIGKVGSCFAAHIADVEVDRETGKVKLLRYTAIQDVGKAVHPAYAEGQIQGGAVQGIGMALNEEYVYNDDGRMLNSSFLDYRIPVANDLPMIDVVMVEVPNPGHPYGVRGVGEVPIIPPMGAIANAIYDSIGVRVRTLPASPRVILKELYPDRF